MGNFQEKLDSSPKKSGTGQKSKRLTINDDALEFTRAMEDWEVKKDAEKGNDMPLFGNSSTHYRRDSVCVFITAGPSWTLLQFNFTVGVRGSISNVDRTESLSFVSRLKAYAVKFSSFPRVDFSRIVGNSFALQYCIRLLS